MFTFMCKETQGRLSSTGVWIICPEIKVLRVWHAQTLAVRMLGMHVALLPLPPCSRIMRCLDLPPSVFIFLPLTGPQVYGCVIVCEGSEIWGVSAEVIGRASLTQQVLQPRNRSISCPGLPVSASVAVIKQLPSLAWEWQRSFSASAFSVCL